MLEGVKRIAATLTPNDDNVSILGMLEGVLKDRRVISSAYRNASFNPWYVGGGVKRAIDQDHVHILIKFQSLVCWRGC